MDTKAAEQTVMSWEEIRRVYPDQWVLLGDLEFDERTPEIHAGCVLGSGATRREAIAAAGAKEGGTEALRYTGRTDGNFLLFGIGMTRT